MLFLPDTTFYIDIERGRDYTRRFLERCLNRGDGLITCPVVLAEYYSGVRPGERFYVDRVLETATMVAITREHGLIAASIRYEERRRGRTVHAADALIAAVAQDAGATIVTENPGDFQHPELQVLSLRPRP